VTFTLTPGFLHDDDMVSNVREEITLRLGDAMFIWHCGLEKAKHF
jgi:hypothetical protein